MRLIKELVCLTNFLYKTGIKKILWGWQGARVPDLGMIEQEGRTILKMIEIAFGKEIKPFIESKNTEGSTIITDRFGG